MPNNSRAALILVGFFSVGCLTPHFTAGTAGQNDFAQVNEWVRDREVRIRFVDGTETEAMAAFFRPDSTAFKVRRSGTLRMVPTCSIWRVEVEHDGYGGVRVAGVLVAVGVVLAASAPRAEGYAGLGRLYGGGLLAGAGLVGLLSGALTEEPSPIIDMKCTDR